MSRSLRTIFPLACFFVVLLPIAADRDRAGEAAAAIYGYDVEPEPGDTFTLARLRIFVPDTCPVARGVYFYVAPRLADSRGHADNPDFQALCDSVDFAMMGAQLDDLHMDSGIGEALLRGLAVFAAMSGRPELEHSAIFFEGYSWGGQFAYHFTQWLPSRVVGFVTQKGGYHDTALTEQAVVVPGYLFVGADDLPYRIANLTGIFEAHRPLGARWILAVQPDAGHEPITDRGLLDDYFRTVAALRLPEEVPPDEPAALLTIPEPGHWLGDRADFSIGAWDCYDAAVDSACWFVSRAVATAWQSFVSGGAQTDTIPCGAVGVLPDEDTGAADGVPPTARLVRIRPNPANPAAQISFQVDVPQRLRITVHDLTGRRLVVLADRTFAPGRRSVVWDGRDRHGRSVASGAYLVRLAGAGGADTHKLTLVR